MKTNLLSFSTLAVWAAAAALAGSSAPVSANVPFRSIVINATPKAGHNTIHHASSAGAVIIGAGNDNSAATSFARLTDRSRTKPAQTLESNLLDWILGILNPLIPKGWNVTPTIPSNHASQAAVPAPGDRLG
jgi:hypothetical protein